jgi:hypothetical protein
MSYHMDDTVNKKIIQLLHELCQWERKTGRRSTLLLLPHDPNERLLVAVDGKPIPDINAAKSDMFYTGAFSERKNKLMTP